MVLLVSAITARGQATALIANGDGTWTLASMPAYNVSLQVEYEDAGTPAESINLINNGDGTWTLASMPAYNVTLQVEYEDDDTPMDGIDLIDNGDGTWTLASMPAYNVTLQVEYEDDDTPTDGINLIDNGDGTWTLASMPDYDVKLVVEYEDYVPKEVYTEFAEETGTLNYYYDILREERSGLTELYDPVNDPDATRFTGYYKKVVKAVIDPSMKEAPLTSTRCMFYGGMNPETWVMQSLSKMTAIEGLENLNTSGVTDMNAMFTLCQKLTMLDLSTFNTSKVTTFNGMFTGCDNLELVDVSSFEISKVTDMEMMFTGCTKLKTICCFNDWSTSTAKSDYMFSGCKALVGGEGTVFDSNVIDKTYARPDGGTGAEGYFTAETATSIVSPPGETEEGAAIYNLAGQQMVNGKWSNGKLPKGINIIRYSDGTAKKVLVK